MRFRRRSAELFGGDVIHGHEPHTGIGEEPRGVLGHVGEVLVEDGAAHPASQRASSPEYHTRGVLPVVPAELRCVDGGYGIGNVDHRRGTDQRVERDLVDGCAAGDEVHRRVDVCAAMRAERIEGQRQRVPLPHVFEERERHRRVPLVDRRLRRVERRRHIDPSLSTQRGRPNGGRRRAVVPCTGCRRDCQKYREERGDTEVRHAVLRKGRAIQEGWHW